MGETTEAVSLRVVRYAWHSFQLLGSTGVLLLDFDSGSTLWLVIGVVGFGVSFPAMGLYYWLRWRSRREARAAAAAQGLPDPFRAAAGAPELPNTAVVPEAIKAWRARRRLRVGGG